MENGMCRIDSWRIKMYSEKDVQHLIVYKKKCTEEVYEGSMAWRLGMWRIKGFPLFSAAVAYNIPWLPQTSYNLYRQSCTLNYGRITGIEPGLPTTYRKWQLVRSFFTIVVCISYQIERAQNDRKTTNVALCKKVYTFYDRIFSIFVSVVSWSWSL